MLVENVDASLIVTVVVVNPDVVEVNVIKLVNVEWVKHVVGVVDHGCCGWNPDL